MAKLIVIAVVAVLVLYVVFKVARWAKRNPMMAKMLGEAAGAIAVAEAKDYVHDAMPVPNEMKSDAKREVASLEEEHAEFDLDALYAQADSLFQSLYAIGGSRAFEADEAQLHPQIEDDAWTGLLGHFEYGDSDYKDDAVLSVVDVTGALVQSRAVTHADDSNLRIEYLAVVRQPISWVGWQVAHGRHGYDVDRTAKPATGTGGWAVRQEWVFRPVGGRYDTWKLAAIRKPGG